MALTYTEFDSTVQNLISDLATAILVSSDWARITPTASQLTTSALAAAAATSLTFTSTAGPGWAIGNVIRIGAFGASDTEYRTITSISGTSIGFSGGLVFSHASGTSIFWGNEVMKCTTTRGADMIVDLNDVALSPSAPNGWGSLNLAAWTSHTGTVGTNKASRWLWWKSTAAARTDPLHVVLSAGKEHLFFSIEGPRVGETNPDSATIGSMRTYFVIGDMTPYHASDTNPCVFVGGTMTNTTTSSFTNNNHLGQLSKTHAGTVGWNLCRLLTLAFSGSGNFASSGHNVQRQTTGDGNYYLGPYVCISDADGFRGRLTSFFNAGTTDWADFNAPGPVPPVGAKVTYSGKTYKLLAVNRYGGASNVAWGVFGAANNTTSQPSDSVIVAVPST